MKELNKLCEVFSKNFDMIQEMLVIFLQINTLASGKNIDRQSNYQVTYSFV